VEEEGERQKVVGVPPQICIRERRSAVCELRKDIAYLGQQRRHKCVLLSDVTSLSWLNICPYGKV
jgi:hypothetical protein